MYPPDGLLTFEGSKHDVELDPHIKAPDPFILDNYLDDFPPADLFQVTTTEELNMNTSEDEPTPGLNGRLRPRKSHVPSPPGKPNIKPEAKSLLDKPKKTSAPSKATPNKQDDLASKSDFSPTPQFLCPYCERKFASKQAVSKHFRRIHYSTPKQDTFFNCLFCNHTEADSNIIRHMVDSHPNQYFACLDCHTRFPSTAELAEHKLNVCEKQKATYPTKLNKIGCGTKKSKKSLNVSRKSNFPNHSKEFQDGHGFNGIVISCELKPPQDHDAADIEDNITTNLILPPSKSLGSGSVLEKNAVIVLDDIQWNKRIPPNFSFHNTDPDQILSRLGVVHRSPRTGESTRKDWFKVLDDATQKFERCFDTQFYSKVASNVQENLTKFLDGSFNFNPDPDSTIKTRKSKNNVVINTAEGFPILLARQQYSRSVFDKYLPRATAPKHKWKWDNLENDRSLMTAAEILKRDSHTNNCIITLVSSLDIWTQLSMRKKFEDKFNIQPIEKKTEKQNIISKQLKEILESREIPTSTQIVKRCSSKSTARSCGLEFPALLGLAPAAPALQPRPAVLSGEWVRPRCLVCCACGEQTSDSKGLSAHISTRHPNANIQSYEIVGEPLLNADILKHLYVPPSQVCNRTRPPRGYRECTKCNKSITLDDLHQHMLDCAGDTPAVRRRQARQRPFGVRRRRPRMPDNTIRKKIRKDIRSRQRRQKTHIGPRPRIRTEVGDAETIRKMLADLPAKRHRVSLNPLNCMQKPRRKLEMQRSKLMKKCTTEEMNSRKQIVRKGISGRKDLSMKIGDTNKNMSNFEDDEDNKPLKPKIKPTSDMSVRRRETFKREAVNKAASRNAKRSIRTSKRKFESTDNIIVETSSTDKIVVEISSKDIQETSLDKSPQKLDVKRASYNTREHAANRGASSSRDNQRPSCSGTNRAANNSCAPTQNVPLKHSIARLTANSETHDKSVQFHHSFLVQQECNNTNEHVPTGQRTLFENEAVVSKLDKPPLNFCQKGFIDIQNLQKNKNSKPRKGLNDCIAMLKNKLVDPVPCQATGYVSVQCGSDEPIEDEPRVATEQIINKDATVNVDFQETLPPQERLNLITKYRQDSTRQSIQGSEYVQQQENSYLGSQYMQETTQKGVNNPESAQVLGKKYLVSQYIQETTELSLQNPECAQPQKQIGLNLYGQDTFHTIKQNPNNSQLQDDNNFAGETHRQETAQNLTHYPKTFQFSENIDYMPRTDEYVQECTPKIKHSSEKASENSQLQKKHFEVQQRRETTKTVKQHFQNHDKNKFVTHGHETAQTLKRNQDDLKLQGKNTLDCPYREETYHFMQNEDSSKLQATTLAPRMQETAQQLKNRPEILHQENVNLISQFDHESIQKLRQNNEAKNMLAHEKTSIVVDCEITKTQGYERSSNSRLRRDLCHTQPPELVKTLDNRLSTQVCNEGVTTDKNRCDSSTTWQKPHDLLQTKSDSMLPTNKHSNSYSEHVITHNKPEIRMESELNTSKTIDVFTESRIRDMPTNIPPAHASTIVESIISAPLDLSSKVLKTTLPDTESYDDYGTLDLSNKRSDKYSDTLLEEDIIVDLRVKPSELRSSPVTLDLCVKPGSSKSGNNPDLNIIDNFPTDLSVKGNGRAIVIQDVSLPPNNVYPQVDTSVKINASIKPKLNQNINYSTSNTKDSTDYISSSIEVEIPNDLTKKMSTKKQIMGLQIVPAIEKPIISEHSKVPDGNILNPQPVSSPSRDLDESSIHKHKYDPTLKIPQYKIRANVPVSETSTEGIVGEPTNSSASTANLGADFTSVSQDLISSNTISSSSETIQVVKTSAMSCSPSALIEAVNSQSIPGRSITSFNKIESTTPVYTLANACIPVTKIKSSKAISLTNTLLSIPGSTIASTTPVYTLTGTTIGTPTSYNNEFVNGSFQSQSNLPTSTITRPNDVYTHVISPCHIKNKGVQDDSTKIDLVVDQDPETAKKIALLPKELVDILGNMPVDHRNQLLNILPQYVTTAGTSCTNSADANQTIRDTTTTVPQMSDLSLEKHANNDATTCDLSIYQESNVNKPVKLTGKGFREKKDYSTYNLTPLAVLHDTMDKYQSVSPNIDSAQMNALKRLDKEKAVSVETEPNTTRALKPKINEGNASLNDFNNAHERIIDLTEDDIIPQIAKVTDVSSAITQQNLSASEGTTILNKQKKSNEKTASLRAVRIKAPSERQKEIQILNRSSVEQLPAQNINESEDKEENKHAHQAATRICCRQINRKGVFSNKLSEDVDENDKLVDTVVAKSESPPPILDCNVSTNKQNDTESDQILQNAVLIPNTVVCKIPQDDSGNNILLSSATKHTDDKKQNQNTYVHEGKCTVMPQEEDSDDDIILAAIVKQKQQKTESQTKRNILKRKVKRSKKNLSSELSSCEDNKTEKILRPSDPVKYITASVDMKIHPENLNNSLKIEHCAEKKRQQDNIHLKTNVEGREIYVEPVKAATKSNAGNTDITDEEKRTYEQVHDNVDESCEEADVKVTKETQKNSEVTDQTQKSQEAVLTKKIILYEQSESTRKREKLKKKKRCSDVNNQSINNQNTFEDLSQAGAKPLETNNDVNDAKISGSQISKNCATISDDLQCCQKGLQGGTEQDLIEMNTQELENDSKIQKPTDKLSENEVTEIKDDEAKNTSHRVTKMEDIKESNALDNDINTPLRRSRRRKSLQMEENAPLRENLSTDIIVEQKAPLTKKQLIFSKLLLDEENQTKALISCPMKEVCSVSDNAVTTNSNLINITVQTCKVNDISEDSNEKLSSVKHKKSPQLKRKSKKKKSINVRTLEDNSTNELSTIDNNIGTSNSLVHSKAVDDPSDKIECDKSNEKLATHRTCDPSAKSTEYNDKIISNDKKCSLSEGSTSFNLNNTSKALVKRKMSEEAISIEIDQNTKPKKTKFDMIKDADSYDDIENKSKSSGTETKEAVPYPKSETFITTCYDVLVPGRRTRSKSVVVQSSSEMYDPYNIDLDDMIQKPEPLRKSGLKVKEVKAKRKKCSVLAYPKITVEIDPPLYSRKEKDRHMCSKPSDREVKSIKSTISGEQSAYTDKKLRPKTPETMDVANKDVISDSDESSKSDVPLKKYVEGKVKKTAELDKTLAVQVDKKNVDHDHISGSKKSQATTASKKTVNTNLSNEIEEQIRSEQFMESFGFFSERKPRKSNLLAMKKISETFHIIANEGEEMFYSGKNRSARRASQTDTKKSSDGNNIQQSPSKKKMKRGRKKKSPTKKVPSYCSVCKKEFHRPDNYIRHQMTLLHVAKLCEIELKQKTMIVIPEEPNYLIAFKQHLDRVKISDKAAKQKKSSKTKIVGPTLVEILEDVHKTIRNQQLSHRGLSRDEALFLDCCELLKESRTPAVPSLMSSAINNYECVAKSSVADLDFIKKSSDKSDTKSDGDVDSITAKSILESEEVRKLENDLISGLREAASIKIANKNIEYHATPCTMTINPHEIFSNSDIHCKQMKMLDRDFGASVASEPNKSRKYPEYKEKMYPDIIDDIDMFEDKFDKIKRKCRSQAAAAKQVQNITEPSPGHKGRKKTEKKKGKKVSKKNHPNTVLTKGALKGFDGIKVSIPTSDINMSAIVPSQESPLKKKKKASSKKKREKKDLETSSRYDCDQRPKDAYSHKKVDVYEFMDNEDAELFEFRPSTLMERFKSINKEAPSTSKGDVLTDEPDNSSASASDGDDFVYMSDDYVCSDDETENSLISEIGNVKNDSKKSTLLKRKDIIEKNAMMGKIFKHNAVRAEKKNIKSKETAKPKANLDQLFDSLLEEEPKTSMLNESNTLKQDEIDSVTPRKSSKHECCTLDENFTLACEINKTLDTLDKRITTKSSPSKKLEHDLSFSKYEVPKRHIFGPSTSKQDFDIYGPSTSKAFDIMFEECGETSGRKRDSSPSKKYDSSPVKKHKTSPKSRKSPLCIEKIPELKQSRIRDKSPLDKFHESEYNPEFDEDTGVARHRARRKCTVGKQNVLSETWSSESEPDGLPPRPTSAESVVTGAGRKKKNRKKDGQQVFGRRGKVTFNKKQDIESRVSSNKCETSGSSTTHTQSSRLSTETVENEKLDAAASARRACPPPPPPPPPTASTSGAAGPQARSRPSTYFWSSEGDEEHEHQQQQHGWIVGNSHKRLVTMLAHAKGRKRNNDEKRNLVE